MTMTTLDRTDRCERHQDQVAEYPCKACIEAAGDGAGTPGRPARTRRTRTLTDPAEIRDAIAGCSLCDDTGRLPGGQACHHNPAAYSAAERGIAAIRAQLAARGGDR